MSSKCNVCHYNRKNIPAPWAKCLKMAHSSDCPACPHVDTSNICNKINLASNNVLDNNSFQNSSKMKITSKLKSRKWRTTKWKRYIQERDDRNCFPTIEILITQNSTDSALHIYFVSNIKCKLWFFIYKASDWTEWEAAHSSVSTSITEENPITKDMLIDGNINVKKSQGSTGEYISLSEYYKNAPNNEKWKLYTKENPQGEKQTTPLTAILEGRVTTHISIGHQPFNHQAFSCQDNDFTMYYVTQGIDNKVRHPRTRILRVMDPPLTTPLYSQPFKFNKFTYFYSDLNNQTALEHWNTQPEKCCMSSIYFTKGWHNMNGSSYATSNVVDNAITYNIIGKESDEILNLDIFNYLDPASSPRYALHQCDSFDSLEEITIYMPNIKRIINDPTSVSRKILKNLKTIKIDDNNKLEEIGEYCFSNFDKLEKLDITTGESPFTIKKSAFQYCDGLKTVTIVLTNNSPKIIFEDNSFSNTTKLENVYINSSSGKEIEITLNNSVFESSTLQYIGKK